MKLFLARSGLDRKKTKESHTHTHSKMIKENLAWSHATSSPERERKNNRGRDVTLIAECLCKPPRRNRRHSFVRLFCTHTPHKNTHTNASTHAYIHAYWWKYDKRSKDTHKHTHASKREGGDLKYTFILKGKQKVNKVMNNAYKVKKY